MSRRSATTTKVFVGSLPAGTTVEQLRDLFAPYGEIAECDVVNRCGFLHLEDQTLALKAIDELNNTTFNGTRISVERGRVKPSRRERERESSRGGSRNGYGGPMRGGRDSYRRGPYVRDGDYDRRGPPRGGYVGTGRGYDKGHSGRSGSRPMNDDYNGGDRRSYKDECGGFGSNGYGSNSGCGISAGGDNMYNDNYTSPYQAVGRPLMDEHNLALMNQRPSFDRHPPMDDRKSVDDRGMMGDRRQIINDRSPAPAGLVNERRPLLNSQSPVLSNTGMHGSSIPAITSSYDRRPQSGPDMYSRRDNTPKPLTMGYGEPNRNTGYGDANRLVGYPEPTRSTSYGDNCTTDYGESGRTGVYVDPARTTSYGEPNRSAGYIDPNRIVGYDSSYSSVQQPRGFSGGPGPRRDMPAVRRF